MLEPSNPMPSPNNSSFKSSTGIEKCCQTPGRSTNFRSTILIPVSLASFRTSSGVLGMISDSLAEKMFGLDDRLGQVEFLLNAQGQIVSPIFARSSLPLGVNP